MNVPNVTRTRGRRLRGYGYVENLDSGQKRERDTQNCNHCQQQLTVGTAEIDGFCSHCQSVVCPRCARLGQQAASAREACKPWAEKIEESIRRQAQRRAIGL